MFTVFGVTIVVYFIKILDQWFRISLMIVKIRAYELKAVCNSKNTWCIYKLLITSFIVMQMYKEQVPDVLNVFKL